MQTLIADHRIKYNLKPSNEPTTSFRIQCKDCKEIYNYEVQTTHLLLWKDGVLIQNAMPELCADERELLISGICGPCFDKFCKFF